ncbi:MOSC domain-containing protein [Actinomadura verrucosospora]|uniref:MOSC N-terminal beta barrel domain family n=1 Tax=Actinomadura verrucosospora TaxID=46165 RepID=A0A7D3VXL4_ACTVE|nr:MOSC N-terminal beta barrel domain-containing protein [Actinomadura verrucosospora]QKG23394.1 MOSC N-terminal beta barrel domain family [Actinomadura verrucosospora]
MTATLTELNAYPLKSGGGTALRTAALTARGLPYDREFMLVTPSGRFLSQRDLAGMALLRPSYDGEVLSVDAPGASRFVHKAVDDGEVLDVTVQRYEARGVDQGDEAAGWFSALLDADCRLVRFTGHRATSRGGGEVMFADGYPLLVISAESLADLNARLDEPLPMNRFRPSLVVEGLGAYAEDSVRLLRVGETVIEMVKACARCVITTTDQETGERGREPLRTLASYRTIDRGIRFGQNAVPRALGTLTVGDPVEVIEAL